MFFEFLDGFDPFHDQSIMHKGDGPVDVHLTLGSVILMIRGEPIPDPCANVQMHVIKCGLIAVFFAF